jgi:AhpD family alkylhydroperoxidase
MMRNRRIVSAVLVVSAALGSFLAHASPGASTSATTSPAASAAYKDIEKTLGFVPTFFRAVDQAAVGPWWEQLKTFQLNPATRLTGRVKELIGLAVAAQVPCEYCVVFHTAAARLNGASQKEVTEAIAMAATTRQWSTVLNGQLTDEAEFRGELDRILAHAGRKGAAAPAPLESINDADAAYRDMQNVLGLKPSFLRRYPRSGIAGAWKFLRSVQLDPRSALPGKVKELIGLAVAAQIPCRYCIVFHTKVARANGATDEEIEEALAMAAITRLGSTLLNGSQTDKATFRRDVDRIVEGARKASAGK